MPAARKAADYPLRGEVWKAAPSGLISVSDEGRAKTLNGNLISPWFVRGQVRWSFGVRGRSYQVKAASLVAELFCGGSHSDAVVHLNGDLKDIRAVNLRSRWRQDQDDVIRRAETIGAAADALGMDHGTVKRRAQTIGKVWERGWTYTYGIPLVDRLSPAKAAIEMLEAAGLSDCDINLALGVTKGARDEQHAANRICLPVLYPAMPPEEIAQALGYRNAHSVRRRLRDLGLMDASHYVGQSLLGPADPIEGEEWREHPCGLWVSSLGRVSGRQGLLKAQVHPGCRPWVHLQHDGQSKSMSVAVLLLEAFRPGLRYSRDIFLNGDFQDVRLANIAGSVDMTGAEEAIRRRIRGPFSEQDRTEIVQAALLAMMEGRAQTPADAVKVGLKELREIAGTYRHKSLDAQNDDGFSMMDVLSSEGEFYQG